jgi:hypothetical protein
MPRKLRNEELHVLSCSQLCSVVCWGSKDKAEVTGYRGLSSSINSDLHTNGLRDMFSGKTLFFSVGVEPRFVAASSMHRL